MKKLAYSIEELSVVSSISAAKIRKDIREGKLKTTLCGTRRVIPYAEVERYLGLTDLNDFVRVSTREDILSQIERIR